MHLSRVLSLAQLPAEESQPEPRRVRRSSHPTLSFSEEDNLSLDELRWETHHPKGHDQAAHLDRPRSGGGELYSSGHLLLLHGHRREALAPHLGGRCLLLALESEIPIRGSGSRDLWLSAHRKAMHGGCRITLARRTALGYCWGRLIAIKDPDGASRCSYRRGKMIDSSFICYHLNVNLSVVPKKQLPRRPSREHADAIREEVNKLKCAGAIKEVFYPEWLANTVVVKKKSEK
nr:hypothetical protein CFP56_08706 [Quercus suber]